MVRRGHLPLHTDIHLGQVGCANASNEIELSVQTIFGRYEEAFNTSWGASAFKGAHGPTLVVPPIRRHLDNNLAWTELMANEDPKFKQGFQGIVVTGWQR